MVLLYAVPMSISVGILRLSRHASEIAATASNLAAPIITTLAIENRKAVLEMSSMLLLSAVASIVTTDAFVALAT